MVGSLHGARASSISSIRFALKISRRGGREAIYLVRTFVSPKKLSASSNVAALTVYPPANPIADLKAEFQRAGITLSWTPPDKTVIGTAPSIAFYRVYRAEIEETHSASANSAANGNTARKPRIQKFPSRASQKPASPPYTDTQTELGKTYMYSVRSVAQYPGVQIESLDSNFATITPKDVFPPPAPQDLVVAFVPAAGGTPAYLDLSWSISAATDIAGYNVYRSDEPSRPGTRREFRVIAYARVSRYECSARSHLFLYRHRDRSLWKRKPGQPAGVRQHSGARSAIEGS